MQQVAQARLTPHSTHDIVACIGSKTSTIPAVYGMLQREQIIRGAGALSLSKKSKKDQADLWSG